MSVRGGYVHPWPVCMMWLVPPGVSRIYSLHKNHLNPLGLDRIWTTAAVYYIIILIVLKLLIVLKNTTEMFHPTLGSSIHSCGIIRAGDLRWIFCGTNGRFIEPATWWIIACMLRHRLSLDSSDIKYTRGVPCCCLDGVNHAFSCQLRLYPWRSINTHTDPAQQIQTADQHTTFYSKA